MLDWVLAIKPAENELDDLFHDVMAT